MTDRHLEQRWLEQNRLANLAAAEGERDAATQAEWEHMERIRAEQRREVPAMPYDCERV